MTFTWAAGRRLSLVNLSGKNVTFTYGADGYRTSKTVNGVTTTYHLDGGRISALKRGSDELSFVYDENGDVMGFYWNGEPYVYAKNLQGDVIGIIDKSGAWAVQYEYDAWGKLLSTTGTKAATIGILNPFRYRSYNYDEETRLYYLNSRYYDPEVGRFLNADGYVSTGQDIQGCNMFAYCGNNPISRADHSGQLWQLVVFAVVAVACVVLLKGDAGSPYGAAEEYKGDNCSYRKFDRAYDWKYFFRVVFSQYSIHCSKFEILSAGCRY